MEARKWRAQEVWDATLEEVSKGWLEGQLVVVEVGSKVGPWWTLSRGFGIVQGQEVNAVNQCRGPGETLRWSCWGAAWTKVLGGSGDEGPGAASFTDDLERQRGRRV